MDRPLDLTPHPERVSDAYAEERIRQKIEMYDEERPKVGLRNVDDHLKARGVSPAVRLHYITALAHLGRRPREDHRARGRLLSEDLAASERPSKR